MVFFAVPGAFTPTCSAKHLPGFVEHADAIKAKGVDEVCCLAVNDPFVMGAWGESQSAGGKVRMLADGNGELTRALGLEMDGTKFGLGMRSQRFAMIVRDGKVAKLMVEEGHASREAFSRCLGRAGNEAEAAADVDLLVRTGGEQRLSDFLLWECAYAEFLFTDVMWPEFGKDPLDEALRSFAGRQRRFGTVPAIEAS